MPLFGPVVLETVCDISVSKTSPFPLRHVGLYYKHKKYYSILRCATSAIFFRGRKKGSLCK